MTINVDRLLEYKPGSILRVLMVNFLTYKEAEVCPGPRLNVVCGPNGSGKSTILCALCLGLGGQPNLLGRADDVKLFIMHEQKSATIEIELAPKANKSGDEPNDVIKRVIIRNKGKSNAGASEWYINGEKSNHRAVKDLVRSYEIAVDNLCTFLPQDRVGSFSGFTAQSLLSETQKALGGNMHNMHERLIELESVVGQNDRTVQTTEQKLEQLNKDRERLEKEKERMNEREECINKIDLLEKKKMWLLFEEKRQIGVELSSQRKESKKALDVVLKKLAPLEQAIERLNAEKEGCLTKVNSKDSEIRKLISEKEKQVRKMESHDDNIHDLASKIDGLERERRNAKKKADQQREKVKAAEDIFASLPSIEDLNTEHQSATTEVRALKKEHDQVKHQYIMLERQHTEAQEKLTVVERKYNKMCDEKLNRREHIFRLQPQLGESFEWVDSNRKLFRKSIYGPIVCELSIKSQTTASYLEQQIPNATLNAYVVQCKEDYDLLYREIREKRNLPINIQLVKETSKVDRMYSESKMKMLQDRYGVIGYLDEELNAPDPVMEAIRVNASVQHVLVGSSKTQDSIDRENLLQILSTRDDSSESSGYCIFSEKNGKAYKFTGMVSRYTGKVNTSVDEITPARMLAPSVSEEKKEELHSLVQKYRGILDEVKPAIAGAREKLDDVMKIGKMANNRLTAVKEEKKNRSKAELKVETERQKLAMIEELANIDQSAERSKLQKKLRKELIFYTAALKSLTSVQEDIMRAQYSKAGMKMTEACILAKAERETMKLEEEYADKNRLQTEFEAVSRELQLVKNELRHLKQTAENNAPLYDASGIELPLKALLEELSTSTVADVEAAIEENRLRVDSMENNPGVLREYTRIIKEIEKAESERDRIVDGVSGSKSELENLFTTWNSRLENCIANVNRKFSTYMKDLDCAGEVILLDASVTPQSESRVMKNSNFKNWGIAIKVRFRTTGSMQVLSAQTHSGGERSVSTIMYMMALQDLMSSPFRCVDEINQGLDERNERLVFKRIVANSTGEPGIVQNDHSGQYFLITPKLLPNLEGMDNPRITAMIVMNGPYNFKDCRDWNVSKFLEAATNRKRQDIDEDGENLIDTKIPGKRSKKN